MAKVTLNFSDEAQSQLQAMADEKCTTLSDVIWKALSTEFFLSKAVKNGAKVLLKAKNGDEQEVILM